MIAAYPDRRAGTGLYAFVEGAPGLAAPALREFVDDSGGRAARAPAGDRGTAAARRRGEVRNEILQLIALNQVDLIDPLIANDHERAVVRRIVADRRNLRDRFAF